MRPLYGIVARELLRFIRQRGRLWSSLARPFVWLLFAGTGFAAVFAGNAQLDYRRFMAPGLLGMVVLFGAFLASLSTVVDRDAGVLRLLLVAPIERAAVVFGKVLGAAVLGTAQALVVGLILVPAVGLRPGATDLILTGSGIVLASLATGALGLALAATMRSLENFASVMNFVVFPMLFLSGALYPVQHLGSWLRVLAYLNPLAYGVDLLKHGLLGHWAGSGYGGEWSVSIDVVVLSVCAIVCTVLATSLIAREGLTSRVGGGS
ncbi:MAG TPA: ABC transporter permease [Gemmatimonadales bacterium]|nr:ABC transporter permease [Gemmatimonadales bacterium]